MKSVFPLALEEIDRLLLKTGEWEGEIQHTCKNGRTLFMATRFALKPDRQTGKHIVLEFNRDITAHKIAMREQEATLSALSTTLEATTDGIVLIRPDLQASVFNRQLLKMFGLSDDGSRCQ